jgi:hypothetical protein
VGSAGVFVIFLAGGELALDRSNGVGRFRNRAGVMAFYARLSALANSDFVRSRKRTIGGGVPHLPVQDRDRLRWFIRQGLAQRHTVAIKFCARTLYRFHFCSIWQRIRVSGRDAAAGRLCTLIVWRSLPIAADARDAHTGFWPGHWAFRFSSIILPTSAWCPGCCRSWACRCP